MGRITSHQATDERYPTLRVAATICTGIGIFLLAAGAVLLAGGVYGFIMGMSSGPPRVDPFGERVVNLTPFISGLGGAFTALWAIGFLVSGLQFLAIGALFRLAIQVEENTRVTAQCLDKIRARLESREENGGGPLFVS